MKLSIRNNSTVSVPKMKLSRLIKKSVIACLSGVIALSSLNAFSVDYSKTEKELRIMTKIFETSLSEAKMKTSRSSPLSSNSAESTYLAKQGMVFTFNFGQSRFGGASDWQAFGEGIGHLVGSISAEIAQSFADIDFEAPVAPRSPAAPRSPFAEDEWEDNMEAYEQYQEMMEELRDEQREKREEVRDLQRSIRDIERQARREDVDSKKLETVKNKLEEKMKVLSKKMEQYDNSMNEYREKQIAQYKLNNQKKSDLITSTLCDYGATLRSLENGEYVTLIFKKFENGKDQVYVFNYKDVKSCSNKDTLLKKAISYQI